MPGPTITPDSRVKPEPWLLRISSAPWNYAMSFVADAALALGLLTWAVMTLDRPGAVAPVVAAALLAYTLIEYVAHRVAFHGPLSPRVIREGHARHHAAPETRIAMPFFAPVGPAMVLLGLAASVLGWNLGALFTGVCALGYFTYDGVHHLVHTPAVQRRPITWLRAMHYVHHARPSLNFGVTTPLWDVVLGTWVAPKKG